MRWTSAISSTELKSFFSKDEGRQQTKHMLAMTNIRESMLGCVDTYAGKGIRELKERIAHAEDLQDLWYLRGDVMAHIAGVAGETKAREETTNLSTMFKGLLPKGMATRPSPLSS